MIVQERRTVAIGNHKTTTSNLFINTEKETLFINFAPIDDLEVPACTFKYSHPTGFNMMCDALADLGFQPGQVIADNEQVAIELEVDVTVTQKDQYRNSSFKIITEE